MKDMDNYFGLNSVVVRSHELLATDLDDEVVIMSMSTGSYYGLSRVGARIWAMVAEARSVDSLIVDLTDIYDVGYEPCKVALLRFLVEMKKQGLIKVLDGPVA